MKNYKCDVAVVAGGAAGLSAAIAAAEKGASVIVLEKSATLGGSANKHAGLFAVESAAQKRAKVSITREQAYTKMMDYVHFRVDPRLVREFVVSAPDTVRWLEEKGAHFTVPVRSFSSAELTWLDSDAPLAKTLVAAAQAAGVQILTETAATELIVTDGKVTGVKAGDEVTVEAGAVVVAAGGFAGCPNAVKELTGYVDGETVVLKAPATNTGDGLKMAHAVGAGKNRTILHMATAIPCDQVSPAVDAIFRQPNLLVNVLGDRIMDEEVFENGSWTANQIAQQKNGCAWMILGEDLIRDYQKNGLDVYGSDYADIDVSSFFHDFTDVCGVVVKADSIEELAEKMGCENADNLAKTLTEYNNYTAAGRDGYFGKSYHSLKEIKAPYYAAKFLPSAESSQGGVRVNWHLQVLTDDFDPIPGLYAAGQDCGNISDDTYMSTMPGIEMGFAIYSGKTAGENAAACAKA